MLGRSERCREVSPAIDVIACYSSVRGAITSMLMRGEYPDDFTKTEKRLTSGDAAKTINFQLADGVLFPPVKYRTAIEPCRPGGSGSFDVKRKNNFYGTSIFVYVPCRQKVMTPTRSHACKQCQQVC